MKNANLAQLPPDFGIMDYLTTQQDDYRNPHATVARPVNIYLNHRIKRILRELLLNKIIKLFIKNREKPGTRF